MNKYDKNGITAVIPVRKGSTRCKNKNIRPFGDTNLLKLKIETLKKVKGIEQIIVSSNCDEMLDIAKSYDVVAYKRDDIYCTNENPGRFFCNLANTINTDILMHVPVTTPLIDHKQYDTIIDKWNDVKWNFDSLNATTKIKEFIWYKNNPVNYDRRHPPPSQELPDYSYLNFGCNIISKKRVNELNNIVGGHPYLFDIDAISGLDIDDNVDFIKTELLYKNHIDNEHICKLILDRRNKKLELLDCTIRDGGYLNNWAFTNEEVVDCYKAVTEAGFQYFEIGFRTCPNLLSDKGKWCYSNEDDIKEIYEKYNGCKIAVMAKMGTVSINNFVKKSDSPITMVRVLLARTVKEGDRQKSFYSEKDIKNTALFCKDLIDFGYEVCVNFGCGDIINDFEIEYIALHFHNINIKSIYLADTYGGFNSNIIFTQLHKFYLEFDKYGSNIPFGFHCHNNQENSLQTVSNAIYHGITMIDSTIGGLGRGAGNFKSEMILSYLYQNDINTYVKYLTPIIEYIDKYILSKELYNKNMCIQNHPYYMLSGVLSLHPDYIHQILLMDTNVKDDIDIILKLDKYTKENEERNYNKLLINDIIQGKISV